MYIELHFDGKCNMIFISIISIILFTFDEEDGVVGIDVTLING